MPGYYRAVPPGQKPFAHRSASHYLSAHGLAPLPVASLRNFLPIADKFRAGLRVEKDELRTTYLWNKSHHQGRNPEELHGLILFEIDKSDRTVQQETYLRRKLGVVLTQRADIAIEGL